MKKRKDIINQKFGKLTAIKFLEGKPLRVKCICECGNEHSVTYGNLVQYLVKSCGCSRKEAGRRCGAHNRLDNGVAAMNALISYYKATAKKRGYNFDLSTEKFLELTKMNCFYCGQEPSQKFKTGNKESGYYIYNGVDRINNKMNYESENCVACCKQCNIAKGSNTLDEFRKWIFKVNGKLNGN